MEHIVPFRFNQRERRIGSFSRFVQSMLRYIIDAMIERDEFEIVRGHQPHNAIMILLEGSFFCRLQDDVSFIAKPGDVVVFPLDCWFERHVMEPCKLYLAYFSVDANSTLWKHLPRGKITFRDSERAKSNQTTLIDLLNKSDELSNAIRQHLLNDILFQYLYESAPLRDSSRTLSPELLFTMNFMTQNLEKQINLDDLSEAAGLSKNGLIKRFRKELGCTPYAYLSGLRLQQAKNLIIHTTLSISQVAEKCGYDNLYYFSNAFKKKFGVSPSFMRKIHSM